MPLPHKEDFMNKLFYPAIFHSAEEGGFWITFPDFPECLTQGDNMEQGYEMAVDALGLCIEDMEKEKRSLPHPSAPADITLDDTSVLLIVEYDKAAYNRKHNSRAIKKTLSIPGWLNEEATALGVNFSQILQEALINKLQAK